MQQRLRSRRGKFWQLQQKSVAQLQRQHFVGSSMKRKTPLFKTRFKNEMGMSYRKRENC